MLTVERRRTIAHAGYRMMGAGAALVVIVGLFGLAVAVPLAFFAGPCAPAVILMGVGALVALTLPFVLVGILLTAADPDDHSPY